MAPTIDRGHRKGISKFLSKLADTIGALLFLTAFSGFIVQVFYRYVLNDPIRWSEELIMIAFIWVVFWAAAFMVPIKSHVTLEVVYDMVPKKTKRIFSLFSMLVIIIAFLLLIPATIDYLDFLTRKKSPVLRIHMHWIYLCYLLFLTGFTIKAGIKVWNLIGPNWKKYI